MEAKPPVIVTGLTIPHFFCKVCGRDWTIFTNGVIRTVKETYPPDKDPTTNRLTRETIDSTKNLYTIKVSANGLHDLRIKLRIIEDRVFMGYSGGVDWEMTSQTST